MTPNGRLLSVSTLRDPDARPSAMDGHLGIREPFFEDEDLHAFQMLEDVVAGCSAGGRVWNSPLNTIDPAEGTQSAISGQFDVDVRNSSTSLGHAGARRNSRPDADYISLLESRIRDFRSLGDGWDGYDASAVSFDAISGALRFMGEIRDRIGGGFPESADPSPLGDVVIYWQNPNLDDYVEVNFSDKGASWICWENPTNEMQIYEEEPTNNDSDDIARTARRIAEKLLEIYSQGQDPMASSHLQKATRS